MAWFGQFMTEPRYPELLQGEGPGPGLGEWLQANGYGEAFRDDHLVPMASALWSSPPEQILQFPARYLVQFMANHQMLQVSGRPQWRVVRGGSARYVDALRARWTVQERLACPVQAIHRHGDRVSVDSAAGSEAFDHVVLACHSDQALALLADASDNEQAILGAIGYQPNEVVLHTDASLLPRRRRTGPTRPPRRRSACICACRGAGPNWSSSCSRPGRQTGRQWFALVHGIDSAQFFVSTLRTCSSKRWQHRPTASKSGASSRSRQSSSSSSRSGARSPTRSSLNSASISAIVRNSKMSKSPSIHKAACQPRIRRE